LTKESLSFLRGLPERVDTPQVTLVHGSPRQPVWEYLLDTFNATRCFRHFNTPFCFVGHTHLPIVFHLQDDQNLAQLQVPEPDTYPTLQPRAIVNPGSVGQPRDRDPRAAYAIFDPDNLSWEYHRVTYDIGAVQERMMALGLPDRHIQRLAAGW
jgi:diadenosine tetraphosphatase ApaH/serine/threonine PP2A family protein phosphatase